MHDIRRIMTLLEDKFEGDTAEKAKLNAYFGDLNAIPIARKKFPDGNGVDRCTHWAMYVYRVLRGRAQLYGFTSDNNDESEIGEKWGSHDFALVDGRYVVDPWLKHIAKMHDCAVLDMKDPAEKSIVDRLYGPKEFWMRDVKVTQSVVNQKAPERTKAMTGVRPFYQGNPWIE